MISLNNQFLATETEPRVTITDDDGNSVSFGRGGDYGRVYEVNLSADVDSVSWQCDMSFRNHEDMDSLDPHSEVSKFNDGTKANYLMSEYHRVKVEVTKDEGSNYLTVFEGYVGEVLGTREVDGNDIIDFGTYDLSQPLRDQPILEDAPNQPYEYYDIDAIACANQILEDNGFDLDVNESASDNPNKTVSEYKVKNTNVWDALTEIFDQTGYKLMFRYHSGNFVLVIVDPGRGVVASEDVDVTFDNGATSPADDGYSKREVTNSGKDVRTKITVFYNDRNTGERKRTTVSDDIARQEWGLPDPGNESADKQHRWMVLKEDDKSLIDTETEAASYGNMALDDLKTPSPDTALDTKYTVPGLQLWDVIEGGFAGDYTVQVGVTSINYSFGIDNQIGSATIKGAAFRIIGNPMYWLNRGQLPDDIDAMKGDRKPPPKPENPPRLEKTTYVDGSGTTRVKVICRGEHNPAWDVAGYQYRYRIRNTDDDTMDEWKYPDQVKNPQKTITGLEVAKNLQLEVEYSAIDWENTEWSGLPGDSPYSDTGTVSLYTDITPPSAPSNLTASNEIQAIELNWDAPTTSKDGSDLTDLNTYVVYWNSTSGFDIDDADGSTKEDGETLTQNLPANTTRYYKITAVDTSGNESLASNEDGATAQTVASSDLQVAGWSSNLNFSAVDSDTVEWDSGTIMTGDGQTFSINSGNTGNMTQSTYIYFDQETSETDLQTSTSASDSVGENKILVAVAEDTSRDEAKFQVFGGQGGQLLSTEELAANIVTANVANLNDIFAADIDVTGTIKSDDSTGLGTGGFWLGEDGAGNYDFSIGADTSVAYLKFDQSTSTLTISGKIILKANSEAGWSYVTDDDTNKPDDNADVTANNTAQDIANLPASPSSAGLYATSTYLGYYNGSSFDAYIKNDGDFYFGGDASNYIEWDGATLTVRGDIVADSISVDSGNVKIGPNALSDNSAGLYVAEGGGIEVADSGGTTIFDSNSAFQGLAVATAGDGTLLAGTFAYDDCPTSGFDNGCWAFQNKDLTVPNGKQWVPVVNTIDTGAASDNNWNIGVVDDTKSDLAGLWYQGGTQQSTGMLPSGTYNNYYLLVTLSPDWVKDDAGNWHYRNHDIFWIVYELPA